MRARRSLLALAVVGLAFGGALAPRSATLGAVPGATAASLLGPLRPLVAAVIRLRFEARRLDDEVLGQLDDAWRVLALVPESALDFTNFAAWFLFDAPAIARSLAERDACVEAGFRLLAVGRQLHPSCGRIDFVEATALISFARHAPERLRGAALAPGESGRRRALELLRRAEQLSMAVPVERELVRAARALAAEEVLARADASPVEVALATTTAHELLAEPDLTDLMRAALQAALHE